MSELAFNLSGEPFEVPAQATGWRVRRLKPKGAPEVVYGRSGIPLVLPIEADIEDLRHEARNEGRYRLDPVDEHGRPILTASAGYVCVQPSESQPELAPLASRGSTENPVIEAMRMNTELARTIIDRFPLMLESAATLLRAADGAGLPAREPRAIADKEEDGDEDETETEEGAPKATGLQGLIETLAPIVMPAIVSAIAGGKLKIPGGVGALLDCRRASPKARAAAATTHVTSTPGAAPEPGPRDPAPAAGGVPARASGPRDAARTARTASRAHVRGPHDPALATGGASSTHASTADGSPAEAEHESAAGAAIASAATEAADELPTLDPAALGHFAAIQGALTFREGMLARALAAELSPAELRTWLAELRTLSVPEAVAKIRGVLGVEGNDNTSGGAS